MEKQKKFQLMEWHRGELIPVKSTDADGKKGNTKTVRITQSEADEMNRDFSTEPKKGTKLKYVLVEGEPTPKEPQGNAPVDDELKKWRAIYEEKVGKKPYYAWTVEQLMDKIDNK